MEKKEFKTESKRILDLMINSIYTHKEIFLRELISNASDALDKLYYQALTENISEINRSDLKIELSLNKDKRQITIVDNGIGMNENELETHLGTIAHSGSFDFKKENDKQEEIDIIGQFGVGFYAAFMVAKQVDVYSKKYNEEQGYLWSSNVNDGYTISKVDYLERGTKIVLTLKDNVADDNYDIYLQEFEIEKLIKKYSDYIHYPIKMDVTSTRKKSDSDDVETIIENKVLNSMVPLWKKNKNDIKQEEYDEFYQAKFNDYNNPSFTINYKVEGAVSFDSLLFIPSKPPFNFYSADFEKGLQLYSRGVFIMDKASDLIPDHFRFVKGLVDSQDLSLNISREMLQHDRQMKIIGEKIEKKIQSELTRILKNEREKYEEFFNNFGLQLKIGIYQSYGMLKDKLQDLLLYYSSKESKLITLKEYVDSMKEDQKYIYFASGESIDKINKLPQVELVKDRGYDVLYLTENVDEFCLQMMHDYAEKEFKNVSQGDLGLESSDEKEELEKATKENNNLLELIKKSLEGKVSDVRLSSRLKTHPVCLVSSEGISFEMEKVMNMMPNNEGIRANRILEINPNHDIFMAIQKAFDNNQEKIKDYSDILYDQALLIEGLSIENPVEFSNKVCQLIIEANK